ncbi:MAG: metallophosphoesterase family protein [Verrucomicrobia bacterium]|nr:MAG: metallophosphoesterase family protein [Verrucomicrobiota bacterium]
MPTGVHLRYSPTIPRSRLATPLAWLTGLIWTAGLLPAFAAGRPAFLTPPYLQNVRPDGITIMWETAGDSEGSVEYGPDPGYGNQVMAAREPTGAGSWVHRAVLQNLLPDNTYHFRVWSGGLPDVDRQFRTAPDGPADFSFVVWGDSQGNNHGAFPGDPDEPTKAMMRHMAASGCAFGVTVGDLAESGASYSDTRRYYLDRVARLLGTQVPWFVAWGNHDGGRDAVIRRFADQPSQERPRFGPGYGSFSFDYGGCHFVCLDYATAAADIRTWLRQDLEQAAARRPRFTFLFIHVPPFCELWIDGDAALRRELTPLLEEFGVAVCFSGHTHEYERGWLNGVYYCVTGGGSWLDSPEVLVHDWPHMTVGGYHEIPGVPRPGPNRGGGLINEYVRVEVRGDEFVASMIGFRPDGTEVGVLDVFSGRAGEPPTPLERPLVGGPEKADFFRDPTIELWCSPFAPGAASTETWARTEWRVSPSPDGAPPWLWEGTTPAGRTNLAVPMAELAPGRTCYVQARHRTTSGRMSAFSDPWPVAIGPAPIHLEDFETTPEFRLPAGWRVFSRSWVDVDAADPENPRSNTYRSWTVVSAERLERVFGANRINVPLVVQGNSVYFESDHRNGVQWGELFTPPYDLRGWRDITVTFLSNYMQNQDSLGAIEYTVDGGAHWRPLLALLDQADVIRTAPGGPVDAPATLTRVDPDGVPTADAGRASGGTYGEHLRNRDWVAWTGAIDPRVNDDPTESKRLEVLRVPGADDQPRVQFRFLYVGTGSWFWGIDDWSIFGTPILPKTLRITAVKVENGGLRVSWTPTTARLRIEHRSSLAHGDWEAASGTLDGADGSVWLPLADDAGFFRLRAEP